MTTSYETILVETDARHLKVAKEEQQSEWLHTPSDAVYIRAGLFDTFMDGVEVVPARRAQRLGGKEQDAGKRTECELLTVRWSRADARHPCQRRSRG